MNNIHRSNPRIPESYSCCLKRSTHIIIKCLGNIIYISEFNIIPLTNNHWSCNVIGWRPHIKSQCIVVHINFCHAAACGNIRNTPHFHCTGVTSTSTARFNFKRKIVRSAARKSVGNSVITARYRCSIHAKAVCAGSRICGCNSSCICSCSNAP